MLTNLDLDSPLLRYLDCSSNKITCLTLICPLLRKLVCYLNALTRLELRCPSLVKAYCYANHRLRILDLDCPRLELLLLGRTHLAELNGLEFCADLKQLTCSRELKKSAENLKHHIPGLTINYSD